jgi:hypothetical protein
MLWTGTTTFSSDIQTQVEKNTYTIHRGLAASTLKEIHCVSSFHSHALITVLMLVNRPYAMHEER